MQYQLKSPEEMQALGLQIASSAKSGNIIALVGGLGAGKTHWTKGFVSGIGSPSEVTSPTFNLIHEYSGGRLPVYHLDFYRLEFPQELLALGWDEYLESGGIIIAEWADKFPELLPKETTWLTFTILPDGSRMIVES